MAGLSQRQLADKLGVSDKTVSAYETERAIPPTSILAKIATTTGVKLSDILELDKENPEDKIIEKLDEISDKLTAIQRLLERKS